MSELGRLQVESVVDAHAIDPEMCHPDLLQGFPVSFPDGTTLSLRSDSKDDGAFNEAFQVAIHPAYSLEVAIAMGYGAPLNLRPNKLARKGQAVWGVGSDQVREALRPPQCKTGQLTDFRLEMVSPDEVMRARTQQKFMYRDAERYPSIEQSQLAFRLSARVGMTVACALGMQIRLDSPRGGRRPFIEGRVLQIPSELALAALAASYDRFCVQARRMTHAIRPVVGGMGTNA